MVHVPKRPGEPDCTFADTSRIRGRLGWEPAVRFEQGVGTMLDNIQLWQGAPIWDPASIADATKDWVKYRGDEPEDTPGNGAASGYRVAHE